MLTDEEVGEWWREAHDEEKRPYGTAGKDRVIGLIRKLVEERIKQHMEWKPGDESTGWVTPRYTYQEKLTEALHDFGIPQDEFAPKGDNDEP